MKIKTLIAMILTTLMPWVSAYGGDGTGVAAADFLNIGVSARTSATGEASAVLCDGPIASFYNPAGLAFTNRTSVAGMHSEWLQDIRYEFLGAATPIGARGGLGVSISYLSLGSIKGYSAGNTATGNISAYDMAAGLSYGHMISPKLSAGIGMREISEKLDDINAHGIAADFGLQYRLSAWDFGLAATNVGPEIKYQASSSPLPTKLDAAVSYYSTAKNLELIAGISVPVHGKAAFRGGLEYTYANMLVLRSGFDSKANNDGNGGLALGMGINLGENSIDYAYNVNSLMGGTHRLSFLIGFGRPRETKAFNASNKAGISSEQQVARRDDSIGQQMNDYPCSDSIITVGCAKESSCNQRSEFFTKLDFRGSDSVLVNADSGEAFRAARYVGGF